MASPVEPPLQSQSKPRHVGSSPVTSCANPYDVKHDNFSRGLLKVTAKYLVSHPSLGGLIIPGQKLCSLCRKTAVEKGLRYAGRGSGRIQESNVQEHVETWEDSPDTGVGGKMTADSNDVNMTTADATLTDVPKGMEQRKAGSGSTGVEQDPDSAGLFGAAVLVKTELKQEPPDPEDTGHLLEDLKPAINMGEMVLVKSEVDPLDDQDLGVRTSEEPATDGSEVKVRTWSGRSGGDDVEIPASVSGAGNTNEESTTPYTHRGRESPSPASGQPPTSSHVCSCCGSAWRNARALRAHEQLNTATKRTAIRCAGCGKLCPNRQELYHHHTTCRKMKRHKCSKCGAGFLIKRDLTAHVTSNCSARPFHCQHCVLTYASVGNLKDHIRTVHRTKVCTCGKVFQSFAIFRRHRLVCSHDGPRGGVRGNADGDDDNFDINHI